MSRRLKPLPTLEGAQLAASAPRSHAALSASAGTGKTQVLTARVLRLLLSGVDPSAILCLTFTKAGAAEMADRIHERLAYWVRLKDDLLAAELAALGESVAPAMRARARTLFARVLDAAGGGLRIQTIHSFAQSLLASFPAEAGLAPGFRAMDAREEQQLARATLAELLVQAERGGDLALITDVQALSHRLGEGGAETFLMRCARAADALAALGSAPGIEARLRRGFDLPLGDIEATIARECGDDCFDVAGLRDVAAHNAAWGTKGGLERADVCARWLSMEATDRAGGLDALHLVWAKSNGEIRSFAKGQAPQVADYPDLATRAFERCAKLVAMRRAAVLVALMAAGLRAGQAYAAAYSAAKRNAGAVDFDDLIRRAEQLLLEPGMGDWVRYKLDQRTDHVLVDEAQDTNESQWNIVRALTEEFFAGEGAACRHRTIFTVGDFKQAIFGFQGTDPREFEQARTYFEGQATAVREAAIEIGLKERELPPGFHDLSMDRSFRSSPPVLDTVDCLIAEVGAEALGLPTHPNRHASAHEGRPGSVTLWRVYCDEAGSADDDAGEETWISDAVRRYAGKLAQQVKTWIDEPFTIGTGRKARPVRPEDILILVRRRSTLAGLIVARLHAEGVTVAGIDRLSLSAPLAVRDLLAGARFAVQPDDDLNLASLLVSPLVGWNQDQLLDAAFDRPGSLWERVRPIDDGTLRHLLAMADYTTPYRFFEDILSGPIDGRRKLTERLGVEARDPIEELLSSALDFEIGAVPSLEGFLDWFARGDVEIVRDPSAPLDAVRVMTVHGSKGLQAPVVILADAAVDPDRSPSRGTMLDLGEGDPPVPVIRPRKEELADPLATQMAAREAAERQEHWRLLYVAMTRAEERLYIGGALGPADRGTPPEASWYASLDRALGALGAEWVDDPRWGAVRCHGAPVVRSGVQAPTQVRRTDLPAWALAQAPTEARPPRPLAPSSLGEDDVASPPPGPAMRAAAERGRLLHQLFERLPGVPEAERTSRAEAWLAGALGVNDPALRRDIVRDACAVIAHPDFAELFGAEALAEAPLAAVLPDGRVIAGTVDRLLVEKDRIRFVDFKTGRGVPDRADDIPLAHRRQMSAYFEALRIVFPGRRIEGGLLYTAGPRLHWLDLPRPADAAG